MPHCYVQVEKKNIGFKNCAKGKGDYSFGRSKKSPDST